MHEDPPSEPPHIEPEPAATLVLVDNTAAPLAIAPPRPRSERLRGLLDAFLRGRKASTMRAYALDLDQFTSFLGAPTREIAVAGFLSQEAGEANALALGYRNHMVDKNLGSATINRRLASLRALTKLARMLGLITWKVEIENVPHENYTDVFGPGAENIGRLIEVSLERGDPQGIRDAAIIRLLYDRGLRRGEVVGCDLEHYHPERGLALIGKGKSQRVWFTLPEATHAAVQAWIRVRGAAPGPLFTALNERHCGHRLTGNRIYEIIRELGETLGIRARPHGIRHAAISAAGVATNGNVQAMQRFSRHSDVRTVLRYDDARRDDALSTAKLVAGSVGEVKEEVERAAPIACVVRPLNLPAKVELYDVITEWRSIADPQEIETLRAGIMTGYIGLDVFHVEGVLSSRAREQIDRYIKAAHAAVDGGEEHARLVAVGMLYLQDCLRVKARWNGHYNGGIADASAVDGSIVVECGTLRSNKVLHALRADQQILVIPYNRGCRMAPEHFKQYILPGAHLTNDLVAVSSVHFGYLFKALRPIPQPDLFKNSASRFFFAPKK